MAAVESTQYERDLRSAKKEWKRTKDSSVKWHHGRRPLPGVRFPAYSFEITAPDSHLPTKSRPEKKPSDGHSLAKHSHNRVKPRPSWTLPDARTRTLNHARTEIRDADSASDMPTSPYAALSRRLSSASTPVTESSSPLFSFDSASTPGHRQPLTLEVFVKTTGRETERLVEREYEVLDGKGDAVRGKKARRVLRRGGSVEREGEGEGEERGVEDEGFELL